MRASGRGLSGLKAGCVDRAIGAGRAVAHAARRDYDGCDISGVGACWDNSGCGLSRDNSGLRGGRSWLRGGGGWLSGDWGWLSGDRFGVGLDEKVLVRAGDSLTAKGMSIVTRRHRA